MKCNNLFRPCYSDYYYVNRFLLKITKLFSSYSDIQSYDLTLLDVEKSDHGYYRCSVEDRDMSVTILLEVEGLFECMCKVAHIFLIKLKCIQIVEQIAEEQKQCLPTQSIVHAQYSYTQQCKLTFVIQFLIFFLLPIQDYLQKNGIKLAH